MGREKGKKRKKEEEKGRREWWKEIEKEKKDDWREELRREEREEGQGREKMEKVRGERGERKKGEREEGGGEKRKGEERRKRREKNVIWKGIEGMDQEERRFVEEVMEREIGRVARIRRMEERKGEAETWVLITEMEELEDKEDILERGGEIKRKWGGGR